MRQLGGRGGEGGEGGEHTMNEGTSATRALCIEYATRQGENAMNQKPALHNAPHCISNKRSVIEVKD